MFLDADGNKILKHTGPRSVAGFESSLEQVEEFQVLVKKAETGDSKAATALFIEQLRLGWYDIMEANKRADGLKKITSKQKKEIAQLLTDIEVRGIAKEAGKDWEKCLEAGEQFAKMWKDKRVPSTQAELLPFWTMMADYAEDKRDKKLFKRIVAEFEDTMKTSSYIRKALKGLESRLDNFPRR